MKLNIKDEILNGVHTQFVGLYNLLQAKNHIYGDPLNGLNMYRDRANPEAWTYCWNEGKDTRIATVIVDVPENSDEICKFNLRCDGPYQFERTDLVIDKILEKFQHSLDSYIPTEEVTEKPKLKSNTTPFGIIDDDDDPELAALREKIKNKDWFYIHYR